MRQLGTALPVFALFGAALASLPGRLAAEEPTLLPKIAVEGASSGRVEAAQEELRATPGGVNLIPADEMRGRSAQTLEDAFAYQPGIVMQEFFGGIDQPRISIRGSGIQSNPVSRGLLLLENGMPINLADGSFIIGQIEPRAARYIAVQRGANALRMGGATLGGTVDFEQFTGRDADRVFLRAEGGSFAYRGGQASFGAAGSAGWDAYGSATYDAADGFRAVNRSDREEVVLNTGFRANDVEIRFSYAYTNLSFDIPGPISKAQIDENPRQVANSFPFFIEQTTPGRESEIHRAAVFGKAGLAGGRLDFGIFAQDVDDVFENQFRFGFTDARTYGGKLAFDHAHTLFGRPNEILVGLWGNWGKMPRRFNLNNNWPGFGPIPAFTRPGYGEVGLQYGAADLDAYNLAFFAEDRFTLVDSLDLVLGAVLSHAGRDAALTDGSKRLDQSYDGVSPKLGLVFRPNEATETFFNVSRSFEAPTFDEIVVDQPLPPARGVSLVALDAQTATTVEVGARGRLGFVRWEGAVYNAWVRDELLTTTDSSGNSATRNYDKTTHRGIEAGASGDLWRGRGGDAVSLRAMYTLSDFSFDGGPYDGNRIAGVPRHVIQAELRYSTAAGFYVAPNLFWSPERTPTDHSNTLYQDSYALAGLTAGYRSEAGWTFFVEGQNLFDKKYAGSYLVTDRPPFPYPSLDRQPVFTSGTGIGVTAGITFAW
jgi:iron complex outermembrane receptor protein